MAMVCPQCNKIYENQERRCAACDAALLFYARFSGGAPAEEDADGQWQHTPWGKIVAGLVLAQGLAIGLQQLVRAWVAAQHDASLTALWDSPIGLAILHGLSVFGLVLGGMLSGACQHRGLLYGSLVGLCNGFIFLMWEWERHAGANLPDWMVYSVPFAHLVVGGIGGCLGKFIWKPTPRFALPEGTGSGIPLPPALEMRWLQGPIHWWRIAAGATLVVCGVIWSHMIVKWIVDYSDGLFNVTTHFQARIVRWEVSGLAILVGALFAGATTSNGMKQGLCVGLGASVMFIGFQLANPTAPLEVTIFSIVSMVGLALVGGWFGGQLFPPLVLARRRRRIVDG